MRRAAAAWLPLAALLLAACETGYPPEATAPRPAPPAPAPAPAAPVVAADPACPVAVTVTIGGTGATRELIAVAENRDGAPRELVLPDRCPAGPVGFAGLPASYDVFDTCIMGACPGGRPDARIGLGVGERRELARVPIDLRRSVCNAALPPGEYLVTAQVPGVDGACVTGARLVVEAAPAPKPDRRPDPKPDPKPDPEPAPPANVDFHACTADSDCIVHCPRAERCCGSPCGCKTAINKAHQAAYDAHHAKTCQKHPDCPAMGCAYEPHHSARCVNNRCRSSKGLGP